MKKQRLRTIINYAALGFLILYIAGIVIMFTIFKFKRLEDDFEFAFAIKYLMWGGVSLLMSVLLLMLTKLAITKE